MPRKPKPSPPAETQAAAEAPATPPVETRVVAETRPTPEALAASAGFPSPPVATPGRLHWRRTVSVDGVPLTLDLRFDLSPALARRPWSCAVWPTQQGYATLHLTRCSDACASPSDAVAAAEAIARVYPWWR